MPDKCVRYVYVGMHVKAPPDRLTYAYRQTQFSHGSARSSTDSEAHNTPVHMPKYADKWLQIQCDAAHAKSFHSGININKPPTCSSTAASAGWAWKSARIDGIPPASGTAFSPASTRAENIAKDQREENRNERHHAHFLQN